MENEKPQYQSQALKSTSLYNASIAIYNRTTLQRHTQETENRKWRINFPKAVQDQLKSIVWMLQLQ